MKPNLMPAQMTLRWATALALAGAVLGPLPTRAAPPGQQPTPPPMVSRGPGKADVSLTVNQAPIRAVLRVLFRRADQNYLFGPFVGGTVTVALHGVPFDAALRQVMAANSVPLTQTLDNGVYIIRGPRPAAGPARGRFPARRYRRGFPGGRRAARGTP